MSQEGYADPITNDRLGFHSIIPVSELIERITRARAIGTRDKTQPLRLGKTEDGVTHTTQIDPYQSPTGLGGSRHPKHLGLRPRTRPIPRLRLDCTPKCLGLRP